MPTDEIICQNAETKNVESHWIPEKCFVELDLKVFLQETGISPGVTSKFLDKHNTKHQIGFQVQSYSICKSVKTTNLMDLQQATFLGKDGWVSGVDDHRML